MAYEIKLVKLVNGDMVLGKVSEDGKKITDAALLQTVPAQQGVQMMLLPFGYPFEQEFCGEVSFDHVIYEYKNFPDELEKKYMEATSNLTLSTPSDLRNLQNIAGDQDLSKLLKK